MELHEKNKIKLALSLENGKVSKRKQNFKMSMKWPVKVLILTFCFSTFFSIFSQLINSKVGIALSILIIFVFLAIGVVFDIIGVATTVCSRNVFFELAKKEDRAAKLACKFVSNSEKVSSFCCDIIGDICGVLSGSAGTSLLIKINMQMSGTLNLLLSLTQFLFG